MMQLSSKNDDSSLCYDVIITHQKFKIDKFGDFSSDIDYNSRTDIFRDDISLIINQCDSRRPKGASGGHKVSASRAAQASEAKRACMFYFTIFGLSSVCSVVTYNSNCIFNI